MAARPRRRFGRLGLGLAAAAAALLGLAPAAEARAPVVTISTPGNGTTVTDASPRISGSASITNGSIDAINMAVSSADGHPTPPANRISDESGQETLTFSWSPNLAYNGHYTVVVTASGTDKPADFNGSEDASASRDFAVEAPPARPRSVKASLNDETRAITVTWAENGEPDLVGYQIQRAIGESDDWSVAGESTKSSFEDRQPSSAAGTYRYRVVAVRKGASSNSGVTSNPSTATEPIVVSAPPSTTTTAPDGGGGGGGNTQPTNPPDGGGGGGGTTNTTTASGGSGGSGGSSTATTGPSSVAPVISRSGKVDMSGFSLLDNTKAPTAKDTPPPDEGFDPNLPFSDRTVTDTENVPVDRGADEIGSGSGLVGGSANREGVKFVAAALLIAVLLMHMLWLKGEVDRPTLEPLPVDEPPAGPKQPGRLRAAGR